MEKFYDFLHFFVSYSALVSHRAKIFYFLDSASDLELNKPYFKTVAAAIAEKTSLLNSKIWT